MKINVPGWAIEHFWEEPPPGYSEFWGFRFEPKCQHGDEIQFCHQGKLIAKATVDVVEEPGESADESTGRFRNSWKVYWTPESFVDLRPSPLVPLPQERGERNRDSAPEGD